MTWAIISTADNSWISGPLDVEPAPTDGQRVIEIVLGYPDRQLWSAERNGFVDIVLADPAAKLSIGRFKLLFTQAERIAIRGAAASSAEVADFLDLLDGFTDGVSPSDPAMVMAIGQLRDAGLLNGERAAAILAGQQPDLS